jgi:hypothetical protein
MIFVRSPAGGLNFEGRGAKSGVEDGVGVRTTWDQSRKKRLAWFGRRTA